MSPHPKAAGFHPIRHDRLIEESRHDAYQSRGKPAEPTVCPQCGVVFRAGRWQRLDRPAGAREEKCPACRRIADDFPAGFVHLSGGFLAEHGDEMMRLVHHTADDEGRQHPLERIMAATPDDDGMLITTTGIHLARRIGEAIEAAYQGELEFHYNAQEMRLRVHWQR